MPDKSNLIPGAGAGDDGIEPRALKSGWRTRRPPAEVVEPHREAIERDLLMIEQLEQAAAIDRLIVERVSGFLEAHGWDQKGNGRQGRRLRVEVEHLGRAVDRLAKRAEQLRRARLDAAMAQRAGIVDLATYFERLGAEEPKAIEGGDAAEIEEGDDDG